MPLRRVRFHLLVIKSKCTIIKLLNYLHVISVGSEFWDSANTLKVLSEKNYFSRDENETDNASLDTWPQTLQNFVEGWIIFAESHHSQDTRWSDS